MKKINKNNYTKCFHLKFWKFPFCYRTHFSTCLNEMELHDNSFYFVGDDVYHYEGDSSEKQKSRDVKKL